MNEIVIFTDGSCYSNGKNDSIAGYGIHFVDDIIPDVAEPLKKKPFTNNRAELMAIKVALQLVFRYERLNKKKFNKITIYTDSNYSLNSLTKWADKWKLNNWKVGKYDIKNRDIIEPLHKIYSKHSQRISLIHVMAHTKNNDYLSKHNEIADLLANEGTKKAIKLKEEVKIIRRNKRTTKLTKDSI
jgi:ribonuclease HI